MEEGERYFIPTNLVLKLIPKIWKVTLAWAELD